MLSFSPPVITARFWINFESIPCLYYPSTLICFRWCNDRRRVYRCVWPDFLLRTWYMTFANTGHDNAQFYYFSAARSNVADARISEVGTPQPSLNLRALHSHEFIFSVNLLAPELFFLILAHTVYKMWIIQEPNTLELWNKLHFEEKKTESVHHV